MDNAFELIWIGFNNVLSWIHTIEYEGITVFQVAVFGLLLSLIWRFGLSPIFGASGGSLSISASDLVSYPKAVKRQEEASQRYSETKAFRARQSQHWSKLEEYYKIRGDYYKSRTKKSR